MESLVTQLQAVASTDETVAHYTTELGARAVILYAGGEYARGRDLAAEAVGLDPMGINAGATISMWARCAIAMADVAGVRDALAAARRVRGRWLGALRLEVEGALAGLEGRADESARRFAEAVDAWRDLDCLLDVALSELEVVQVLGADHPLAVTAKEAEDVFTELGARPYLERLAALRVR